jgi:hypothetical protein
VKWWRRLFAPPKPRGHHCLAIDCDQRAEPQDGPFCPVHGWDNWRGEHDSNRCTETVTDSDGYVWRCLLDRGVHEHVMPTDLPRREHVHDVSCSFGNPTCPLFGEDRS